MKNLMIALCFGCFLYSCSTNDPEPEQKIVYVDKIIEVPVPIAGGEYPDSLKLFFKTRPDFIDYLTNKFKDQSGLIVISYGDNSLHNINDFNASAKLPWHTISVVVYTYSVNGALVPGVNADYPVSTTSSEVRSYDSWSTGNSGLNKNFYGNGQVIIKTFTNP